MFTIGTTSGLIKCGFEADECWPSTLKKLRDFSTFFRCGDYRDVCSSYLTLNGKLSGGMKHYAWCVQASTLYAERFLPGDVCHVEG